MYRVYDFMMIIIKIIIIIITANVQCICLTVLTSILWIMGYVELCTNVFIRNQRGTSMI